MPSPMNYCPATSEIGQHRVRSLRVFSILGLALTGFIGNVGSPSRKQPGKARYPAADGLRVGCLVPGNSAHTGLVEQSKEVMDGLSARLNALSVGQAFVHCEQIVFGGAAPVTQIKVKQPATELCHYSPDDRR